jgi:hypothetical protein
MSTLSHTYVPANSGRMARPSTKTPAKHGFWSRLFKAVIDARERDVRLALQRRGVRLPTELEQAGWNVSPRNEDSLPFN